MIIESLPDIEFSRCIAKIYVRSLSNKEEMFQFVVDHQEELVQVVCEMVSNYGTSDDRIIDPYEYDRELSALDNVNELFREISVMRISIENMEEENQIDMLFDYAPVGYEYWGIYYSETGEPADWGAEVNFFSKTVRRYLCAARELFQI